MKRVKITGTPSRKVRISAVPDSIPEMALGGNTYVPGGQGSYGNQQSGHGYALDRSWSSPAGYPGSTSKVDPFGRVGTTLPEAENGGDINAEKNERVLGDFDQDGNMELMNVGGPSHAEGGKDVDVPSGSFVFSDTKDLKIKDPAVLAQFAMGPKRGGYTPADIAKKYDLNKYKKVTSDPDADDHSQKTAQLMSDNYLAKLSKLAEVQEKMKKYMGMEHSADGVSRYGGQAPAYQYGGKSAVNTDDDPNAVANAAVGQTVNPVYNMYPNVLTGEGYTHERPTADNMQSFVGQSINQRPNTYGKPIIPVNTDAGRAQYDAMRRAGWDGTEDPGTWAQRAQPNAVQQAIQNSGMTATASDAISGNALGNKFYGPRWRNFSPQGPDYNPTFQDVQAGSDNSLPPSATVPPPGSIPAAAAKKKADVTRTGRQWDFGIDPNLYGNLQSVLAMANLRKFVPYEPVPQAVIPDTVFLDPTRAIAAQQEEARSGSEMDAMSANPQAARAMGLARQGIAGKQAADTIGQYHNQNVQIANAAAQGAAGITNQLMDKQANRLSELNKANFLSDREYQKQMSTLQKEYAVRLQQQHNADVNRQRYNKWNPYFAMDRSGYYQLKPGVTEAKLQEMYMNRGQSGAGDFAQRAALAKSYKDELMRQGFTEAQAEHLAAGNAGLREHESQSYKPGAVMPTTRRTGLPMSGVQDPFAMEYPQMGTPDAPYQNGGPLMKMGGKTDLYNNTKLKKFLK